MGKWPILVFLQGSILISLRHGDWGSVQDCRPNPEIAAQCEQYQQCLFLSFKGTRDNLHIESSCLIINFLRDKPLFNTKDCHGAKR